MGRKKLFATEIFSDSEKLWKAMSFYEKFEQIIAIILSFIIAVIIVLSVVSLLGKLFPLLLSSSFDPLDHSIFQSLFGMIMTILIALEFKHSIIRAALRQDSIIQVRTIVLIALLALGRKFIILDTSITSATTIAALSGAILALGIVYWLLRSADREDEKQAESRE